MDEHLLRQRGIFEKDMQVPLHVHINGKLEKERSWYHGQDGLQNARKEPRLWMSQPAPDKTTAPFR